MNWRQFRWTYGRANMGTRNCKSTCWERDRSFAEPQVLRGRSYASRSDRGEVAAESFCCQVRADSLETCRFFHPPQHSREILVNVARQFLGVYVKRSFCRWHQDMFFCRRLEDQFEILVHQAQRKLRTVIVDHCTRQLSQMRRSEHSCLR